VSEHIQKPLKADEIEAMLRSARQMEPNRSDIVSNEPLGPGDVQHLRNTGFDESSLQDTGWPYDDIGTDELLQSAQQNLAEAMANDEIFTSPSQPAKTFPPLTPPPAPATTSSSSSTPSGVPLSVIGDLELDLTLELGRADLLIEDLLALREGSVVTLDKDAGDPIDILANGKLVARGEVIVIDEKFCVRICEVLG
jgi:flagellar motor switch protein FliN/FliY